LVCLVCLTVCESRADEDAPPGEWNEMARRPDAPPGQWSVARSPRPTGERTPELERLESLGYLAGGAPASGSSGVTIHEAARSWAGLNLYVSGEFPGARLVDMDGRVVHEWRYDFDRAWPERRREYATDRGARNWIHAHLFENGDVIGIFNDLGMVKLDVNSELLWKYGGGSHHDLHVADDGRIFVITHRDLSTPKVRRAATVVEDAVTVLDERGNELDRVSLLDAFWNSDYASSLKEGAGGLRGQRLDLFHANRIVPLDGRLAGRIPAFREGNFLLSLRSMNALAVIDIDSEEIVWTASGLWLQQHCPSVTEGGNILLFDNQGNYGWSRVLEFDPVTQEIVWEYKGEEASDFYSARFGTAQRLPNGNTLVAESHYGRAIEVTPEGDVVWEFLNPARAGSDGELVANLFEIERVPRSYVESWLD
ncbi:MAG: hypothetical protein GF400_10035, partial [Candidatus Eisenbacteria bacterium]|nr:hypothetical protein [Candidatus Eisenbacteria bacterium]